MLLEPAAKSSIMGMSFMERHYEIPSPLSMFERQRPSTMPDNTPRRYTPEQVNAILRRAIDRQGAGATSSVTHEDLLETARELGIDAAQVEAALTEHETQGSMDDARIRWRAQRKKKFFEHLRTYLIINSMLFLMDYFLTGGVWFFWCLFGWGIGILFDASDTFFPKDKDIERGARRLLEREARLQAKDVKIGKGAKSVTIDSKGGRIVIEKGGKRIEIG
jgi:hypothetical protein